ncbi:MAG TPA: helix-hairpin-helix domain-containing protein, partial [Planctomycetota bacterium]|nr:helix-hairpin-helix domain-containing protein [Planctomycetota bacterium]
DLLLAAPAGPKVTIGLDPGLRTGVKFAVIDGTGKLLEHGTIWPHAPRNDREGSISTLAELARKHQVEIIAIGNGTASRETDRLVKELIQRHPDLGLERLVVNEAGASVYSASEIAAKEFPNVDVSFRGAVSIARRLQDPLAELVKIEPRSIGVGQYQHDVNQTRLARALDAVVEDCVNAVGVDVNTASAQLLTRVSGLNRALAENIVLHRDEHGPFRRRSQLLDVPRMGEKSYEQSAGFLRIMNGEDPLDASAVHPESYPIVQKIVERTQKSVRELMSDAAFLRTLDPKDYVDDTFGLPTVTDIIRELEKPGRDPRPDFVTASFAEGVESLEDLKPDMIVEGVVTNVTNFGAFVDIGVHQDGLVHISRLSSRFVKDPREVVKPGDVVKVKVLQVDTERKRVGLSMRLDEDASAESEGGASGGARGGRGGRRREGRGPRRRPSGAEGRGSAGASAEGRGPGGGDRDRPRGRRDGGRRGGDRRHGAPGGGRRGDGGRRDVEPSGARGGRPRDEGPTLFGRLLDQALEEARRRKEKE